QVIGARVDAVLGEAALAELDLAAPADAAAAAHGVDIDAEHARGLEHGGAACERAALARRREHDTHLRGGFGREGIVAFDGGVDPAGQFISAAVATDYDRARRRRPARFSLAPPCPSAAGSR